MPTENIKVTENGRAAVELTKKEMFDLIVMDIRLPDMNGIDATKEIRSQYTRNTPKIIAYTATAPFISDPCMELMDGIYLKATKSENFKRIIKTLQWENSKALNT
jgi:CheY-like chemotaxis protein